MNSWSKRRQGEKKPKNVGSHCEEGMEDFKYNTNDGSDKLTAMKELVGKLLEWKRPGEAFVMQSFYEEGYNLLAEDCLIAMKYHGLDAHVRGRCEE